MNPVVHVPERMTGEIDNLLKLAAGLGRLGAWSLELADGKLTWSDEVCAILEMPAGHCPTVGEAQTFVAPEHLPMLRDVFDRCVQLGFPYDLQMQAVTARGRRIWVRAIGQAGYDAHGAIVRVHGAFQDITPLVRVHEEKRLLAERLTVTLESMTEGFYVVDQEWRITYANSEAARLMGLRRNEALGRILWEVFPEAVGTVFHREFERALVSHEPVELDEHYEPLDIWVQVRAYPSSFGLAVAFRDVTRHRRAEIEVRRLNAELEVRVQERTAKLQVAVGDLETFAYAVAHDLRTPLCAGKAFTQALALAEGSRLGAQGKAYLQSIRDSLQYMDGMTVGLLGLAKLSKAELRRERVDLSLLAASIVDVHHVAEPLRDVKVRVQKNVFVDADRVLIAEVLQNLIGNAWKFTQETKGARIEVGACRRSGGERVFYVKDNGPGFAMKAAKRLFDPFVRLTSRFDGTGLGLATVQKIVNRHGGRVWAWAAVGRGASFFFTIPEDCPDPSGKA